MSGTLLSLGHGYTAQALARRLLPRGWRILATTRSRERAAGLAATGVTPLVWPGTPLAGPLAQATHLLSSVPPAGGADPVLAAAGAEIAAAAPHLRWAGYLSTTGVYGDHAGGWVDEDTPRAAATARGRARVAAEEAWEARARESGLPLHIFRLAGIYGPGRSPFGRLRAGTARAVIKPGQVFSRIHVEDIAAAIEASMDRPDPGAIYNLADDLPAPPQDVLAHAAALAGLPPPPEVPFEDADLSPMAASFYAESKRVRNDRLKALLGHPLRFPDYRAGLAAILAEEQAG